MLSALSKGLSNMDWNSFAILVVIGLDGYLYWHFSNIFNIQFELTNKMLTAFQNNRTTKRNCKTWFRYYRQRSDAARRTGGIIMDLFFSSDGFTVFSLHILTEFFLP